MNKKCIVSHLALGLAAGWVLQPAHVWALPDPAVSVAINQAPVTLEGRGGDFADVLASDVAAGYMTQAQADSLLQDYERIASQRDTALARFQSQMAALGQSSKAQMDETLLILRDFGQDADTAQDQVDAFVDLVSASERQNVALLNGVAQVLSVYSTGVSELVAKRAEILGQNPNLSREQRAAVNLEASKINRAAYSLNDRMQKGIVVQEEKVARAENQAQDAKKDVGRELKEKAPKIKEYTDKYGSDPRKWPQDPDNPLPLARSPVQPQGRPEGRPQASGPASNPSPVQAPDVSPISARPSQSPAQPGARPTSTVTVEKDTSRPVVVPNRRGTVPTNQPDPALSATRNSPKPSAPPSSRPQTAPASSRTAAAKPSGQASGGSSATTKRPPQPPAQLTPEDIERILSQQVTLPKPPSGRKPTTDIGLPSTAKRKSSGNTAQASQTGNAGSGVAGAAAGASAGAGAATAGGPSAQTKGKDPNQGLKLPPLGRAGRGDGGAAGGSGGGTPDEWAGGDGFDAPDTPDRLTASEISAAGDGLWTMGDSFNTQTPQPRAMNFNWSGIEANGPMTTVSLEPIYQGYDPSSPANGTVARSLSAAPTSLPLNWSLPSYGDTILPLNWAALDLNGAPVSGPRNDGNSGRQGRDISAQTVSPYRSLFDYSDFQGPSPYALRPWEDIAPTLVANLYTGRKPGGGGYATRSDPTGQNGQISLSSRFVGYLSGEDDFLTQLATNGRGGLDQLLAQPFNVLLTWGAGAYDLDLHMTGPLGEGTTNRFHIYYVNRGSLTALPYAELIKDCICNSGSEVILTSQLIKGGVYRISVFNFGDQSASSSILSTLAEAEIQIVRGGQAVSVGDGTTIVGGRTIYRGKPKKDQKGNTWTAVEINATTGRIFATDAVTQTQGSDNVR
jgi:hypothetical protein